MDFMKVFDQTVREIKREVNTRVLKVPEIEQKVLDATSNEPWGPHGTVLQEIAQATKNFTECQMIMNVLWTRLTDTGRNWRHVYKALSVIEYLVANGAERVVDDIIEHTYQISSISEFEYVEPSGKDVGINVRKKVETILALLNNKDKVQEVRQKAAANREKYFGLSSTGITFKSSSASYGGGGFGSNDRFGGQSGGREDDTFKDSYKDRDQYGEESDWNHGKGDDYDKDGHEKSRRGNTSENEGSRSKNGATSYGRDQDANKRLSTKSSHANRNGDPAPSSQSLRSPPNNVEDDFDDFDPRGSSKAGAATASFNQVDLLAQDLFDAPAAIPTTKAKMNGNTVTEIDLFADADFVSAAPHVETGAGSHVETGAGSHAQPVIDLFGQQPAFSPAFPSTVDFFAAPGPVLPTESETKPKSDPINLTATDPFAAVPLNNFEGSELFGDFTSHTDSLSTEPTQGFANEGLKNPNQNSTAESKAPPKKDNFQIKSGIWADSLSRGLIDLNISAPKKTSLADIGIVGGLGDGSDEKEKGPIWSTSSYMGRAMGAGSGLGRSGFTSAGMGEGSFSSENMQHYGSFK